MNNEELCFTPATELARMIRNKSVSPVEITRAVLERVERLNPTLNALCTLTAESAFEAARVAESAVMRGDRLAPLHGIPVTIKDLAMTRGVRTMAGSHVFSERVPEIDGAADRRRPQPRPARAAGLARLRTHAPLGSKSPDLLNAVQSKSCYGGKGSFHSSAKTPSRSHHRLTPTTA